MTEKICFLCGKAGADTKEHVVPRCLYPGGRLPNDNRVLFLPAHQSCNGFTKKDEELFRNHVATSIEPGHPARELVNTTVRAFQNPKGRRMAEAYWNDALKLPYLDAEGNVRSQAVVARIRRERADRVLAKIVKGLFTLKTGEIFPNDETLVWQTHAIAVKFDDVGLPGLQETFPVHDVLDVRWGRDSCYQFLTLWTLRFHDRIRFSVMTKPAWGDQRLSLGVAPPAPIIWP